MTVLLTTSNNKSLTVITTLEFTVIPGDLVHLEFDKCQNNFKVESIDPTTQEVTLVEFGYFADKIGADNRDLSESDFTNLVSAKLLES